MFFCDTASFGMDAVQLRRIVAFAFNPNALLIGQKYFA